MNVIERAVIQTLRDHNKTFYASLLGQMRRIEVDGKDPLIDTAAVSVQGGRIYLYWCPAFFNTLTLPQQVAVLEHECLHLVYFHLLRKGKRNPQLWNWAADLAINQFIENLPPHAITIPSMSKILKQRLEEKRAADVYYDILEKYANKYGISHNADGSITITRPDGSQVTLKPFDSHEPWSEHQDQGIDGLDAEVIRQAVKEAYQQQQRRGTLPAGVLEAIEEMLRPPTIPWTREIKHWVGNQVKGHYKLTWKRLSRRIETEDFKGKNRVRLLKLMVGLDTSGSVQQAEFSEFFSELKGIQKAYKSDITILECDAKVQKEYKLRQHSEIDYHVKGRGGTDFRPFFEYIQEHRLNPDAVIFFTDLCAAFPDKPPPYPVLWVVPSSAADYYKTYAKNLFGKVVVINNGTTKKKAA